MSTILDDAPSPPQTGTDGASVAGPSVTGLVSGIIADAQTLIRQQAEMFKAELQQDFQRSKRAAEFGALGIVCTTVGTLGLMSALAYLLHEQLQFAMWASWGIVGGLFFLAGVASGGVSYVLLERFNLLPDKTIRSLKDLLAWKTK